MIPLRIRGLIAGTLVTVACAATARPLYEMTFKGPPPDVRARWVRLLATRYKCDTAGLGSAAPAGRSGAPRGQPSAPPMIDMGRDVSGKPMIVPNPVGENPATRAPAPSHVPAGPPLGSTPCQVGGTVPSKVRVFVTEGRMREEWQVSGLVAYEFEGPDPANLRLTFVPQR